MNLTTLVNAKVKRYHGGTFLYVERGLDGVDADEVKEYLRKYKHAITLPSIRRRFPEAAI